jgi:hypothetical protein
MWVFSAKIHPNNGDNWMNKYGIDDKAWQQ